MLWSVSVVACTEMDPGTSPGQPTEHQLNHADPDLRLAGISQVFIILAVNPAPTQPAKVRSTTHRHGNSLNRLSPVGRLTTSITYHPFFETHRFRA